MLSWRRIVYIPLLLGITGCGVFQHTDHFSAHEIAFADLSGWAADDQAQALQVFTLSCPILAKKPSAATGSSHIQISQEVWNSICDEALHVPPMNSEQARAFFERRFTPFRITNNGKENGLFTGYYEPVLYGSRKKGGDFLYPLYMPPPELESRNLSHEEIDHGGLAKKQLELVWVDDPVMLFFLQVQGSGRIRFKDGTEMPIGYAGKNGHNYESLGKIMGDEGLIPKDQINFFTLRQWLYDHKDKAMQMMERNPSYVYFKRGNQLGAVGSVGAVLTKERSLAVDNHYIPYGLPLFLETELPSESGSAITFEQTLIAQDTGGAIKGPVRGDIFFGAGDDAEYLAGNMHGRGIYSLLVPNEITSQLR